MQRSRGFIGDEALADIAEFLALSPAEVDGVATFYNLIFRKPVGRHVILLCDSVSCWIMGYGKVRSALCTQLGIGDFGETSADGRFTLLPVPCLGACHHAPSFLVDGELHRDVAPDDVASILAHYP